MNKAKNIQSGLRKAEKDQEIHNVLQIADNMMSLEKVVSEHPYKDIQNITKYLELCRSYQLCIDDLDKKKLLDKDLEKKLQLITKRKVNKL